LSVRLDAGQVVVSVRDDGIGIAPDRLAEVFDLFTQVDRSLGRAQGGLGIGLTLVRRLVEMHEGRVEAHSDGPGQGAEFVVTLPRHGGHAPDVAMPAATPSLLAPRRVLVVDDNVDAGESLELLLRMLGADSRVVHDGESALAMLSSFRPEMVLLDLGMPGMDGYEVARRIREQPGGGAILVIALTGWGQPEDRRRTQEAGFDSHLVKPVSLGVLQSLLAESEVPRTGAG
jgi:CheY-like chemotaxis protein